MRIQLKHSAILEVDGKEIKRIKRIGIDTDDIRSVVQAHNTSGKLIQNKCIIIHENLGNLIIYKSFDEMYHIWNNQAFQIKGFKQYKNNKNGKF